MAVINVNPYQKTISQGIAFSIVYTSIILGIPCLLLTCFLSTFATISASEHHATTSTIATFLSPDIVLFCLISWYVLYSRKNKQVLSKVINSIKCESFSPSKDDECFELQNNAYLGIDTKSGSILYIARVDRFGFRPLKELLVMGFDINNISSFEYRGNKFTIMTKEPDIPSITFQHSKAKIFFDKLNIMRRKKFDYPYDVPGWMEHQATRTTEQLGLDLILPRR